MVDLTRYTPPRLREPLRQAAGLGYSLLDNIIGLDDGYQSAGERFGAQLRQDPIGVGKAIGSGIFDSVVGAVKDPVGAVKGVATGIADSYGNASQGAAAYLPEGVTLKTASISELRAANDAYLADVANLASIVPATRAVGAGARALDNAYGADIIGAGRAIASGDMGMLGEVIQRGREAKGLSADIKRVPVRGYDPDEIARLEANIGLRDEKGRATKDALMAMASQFDAFGNRINNIKPDRETGLTNLHPASNVRMDTPVERQKIERRIRGEANKRRNTEIKKGDALVAAFGDRAIADTDIFGYAGQELTNPVSMYGGSGYLRDKKNRRIWASDEEVTKPLLRALERSALDGYNPRMIYTAMGAQAGDFATDELLRDYIRGVDIDPKLRQVLADRLRASKDFTDKDFPFDALISGGNSRRNMRGLLDGVEDYFGNLTGSNRRAIWQAMDNATFRDAGIPVGEARIAMTDPDLLYANPFDTGLNLGRPTLGKAISQRSRHPIYPTSILGAYDGSLPVQVPAALTFKDFFDMRRGRVAGSKPTSPASDQRSFLMSHKNIIQPVTSQIEDEIAAFTEYWRMFNQ